MLRYDPRFIAHHRQPRVGKLDKRQFEICQKDLAYRSALEERVADPRRFGAFLAGASQYIRLGEPCPKCLGFRRRVRDRSCYTCHLERGKDNFERMKAGISPTKQRSRASYLDMLERQKAEAVGDFVERQFGEFTLRQYPTGRLWVTFPDGYVTEDLNTYDPGSVFALREKHPNFNSALDWAGWR